MLRTRITEAYGLSAPFVSAGMALIAGVPMVCAVCAAGGMGVLGAAAMPPQQLRMAIRAIRASGAHMFGVDIIPRFADDAHIAACTEEKVPVVVFFWDEPPTQWIMQLREAGCRIWVQVGSVAEARRALVNNVDALVAQGSEGGGHNRAAAATMSLLPAIVDSAGVTPVIASGGIADGRAAAAVLALGADAVLVGTRLLASHEAYAHEEYKRRVVTAEVHQTARHRIFGIEFPDASVRGLRNEIVRIWEGKDDPPPYKRIAVDDLPVIGEANVFGKVLPLRQFMGFPPTPDFKGDFEQMSLLAGESVGQTYEIKGAGEIVREIIEGAEEVIQRRLLPMIQK